MKRQHLPSPIAIDGPAASGKTTVGRALAARYGYRFLDTGLMYRAFTLAALRLNIPADEPERCATLANLLALHLEGEAEARVLLGQEDVSELLRAPEVEMKVSPYSAVAEVREVLVRLQREFAASGNTVLAGRDIGTVVLPGAPLKLYLDASEHTRAARRGEQASEWGADQEADGARQDIARRDRIDSSRTASPLRASADAVVVDTTALTLEETIARVLEIVECWRA